MLLRFDFAASQAINNLLRKSDTYWSNFKGVSSCARNFSFKSFKGPRTVWPNTSSKGLKPRGSCTDSLTAKSKRCISIFFCIKTVWPYYIFQGLMKSFKGTLAFRMICWWPILFNSQFMHYLLENTRHKIWTLSRLNWLRKAYKSRKTWLKPSRWSLF